MRKFIFIFGLFLACCTMILSVQQVRAAAPYIKVYGENGEYRDQFASGERIGIEVYFPSPMYEVKVYDPDGDRCYHEWVVFSTHFDSGLLADLTDKMGSWEIKAGVRILCFRWYKVQTYHVVPISEFGVLGIVAACFIGYGIKHLAHTRKSEPK